MFWDIKMPNHIQTKQQEIGSPLTRPCRALIIRTVIERAQDETSPVGVNTLCQHHSARSDPNLHCYSSIESKQSTLVTTWINSCASRIVSVVSSHSVVEKDSITICDSLGSACLCIQYRPAPVDRELSMNQLVPD